MWMSANIATKKMVADRFHFYKTLANVVSSVFFVLFGIFLLMSFIFMDIVFIIVLVLLIAGLCYAKKYVLKFVSDLEAKPVFVNDGLLKSKQIINKRISSNKRKNSYQFTLEIDEEEFDVIVHGLDYLNYEVGSNVPVICIGSDFSRMEIYDWRN